MLNLHQYVVLYAVYAETAQLLSKSHTRILRLFQSPPTEGAFIFAYETLKLPKDKSALQAKGQTIK